MLKLISMFFPRENRSPDSYDYSGKGQLLCHQCELINWVGGQRAAVVLQTMSSLPRHCSTSIGDRGLVLESGICWPMCGKTRSSAGGGLEQKIARAQGTHT